VENVDSDPKMISLLKFIRRLAREYGLDPDKAETIFRVLLETDADKGISDEELAQKLGYKQSDVRRVLRLLYVYRFANYRRGRHPRTGATRYYWYIDIMHLNIVLVWLKKAVLEKLKYRLEYEEANIFYRCPRDGTRYTFEEAFQYDFQCPRCGSILEEDDNTQTKKILASYIRRLEEEIEEDERRLRAD